MNVLQYPEMNDNICLQSFKNETHKKGLKVLELGTKRSNPNIPTHHRHWFDEPSLYVMSDLEEGLDVDVVVDAHQLTHQLEKGFFDAVVACSVFEHLRRPWDVAKEIIDVLTPGGAFFIQTHLVFPEHGYPDDYFRFTQEGLKSLFDQLPVQALISSYDYACAIIPKDKEVVWNAQAPAYLNVNLSGKKIYGL